MNIDKFAERHTIIVIKVMIDERICTLSSNFNKVILIMLHMINIEN
jgi:hypothetical protein